MQSDPGREHDDRLSVSVTRFENMLANNDQYYFDVSDLEELIDHYLERLDLDVVVGVQVAHAEADKPLEAKVLLVAERLGQRR